MSWAIKMVEKGVKNKYTDSFLLTFSPLRSYPSRGHQLLAFRQCFLPISSPSPFTRFLLSRHLPHLQTPKHKLLYSEDAFHPQTRTANFRHGYRRVCLEHYIPCPASNTHRQEIVGAFAGELSVDDVGTLRYVRLSRKLIR